MKAWGLYDGDDQCGLPAVVILDRSRRVVWRQVSSTMYERADEDEVIQELTKLREAAPPATPPR